jgi:hypothetical protein
VFPGSEEDDKQDNSFSGGLRFEAERAVGAI